MLLALLLSTAPVYGPQPLHITDTTPHYDEWIMGGIWCRDDTQFPSGAAPGTSQPADFLLPATGPLPAGTVIHYQFDTYAAPKWKFENRDPLVSLPLTGGITADFGLFCMDDNREWEYFNYTQSSARRYYGYYYGPMGPITLQPYDGVTDGMGPSGQTNTCPGTVVGAEGTEGNPPTCFTSWGLYQQDQYSKRAVNYMSARQKHALETTGLPMRFQAGLGLYGDHDYGWFGGHGFVNMSDLYLQVRVRVWIEYPWF